MKFSVCKYHLYNVKYASVPKKEEAKMQDKAIIVFTSRGPRRVGGIGSCAVNSVSELVLSDAFICMNESESVKMD